MVTNLHHKEPSLRNRLAAGVNVSLTVHSILLTLIGLFEFYHFYYFTGNDTIQFVDPDACDPTVSGWLECEELSEGHLIIYAQTRFYPTDPVKRLHTYLRKLQEEISQSHLSVVYFEPSCKSGLSAILEQYEYRKFVKKHDLHGVHVTVPCTNTYRFASDNGFDWSPLWFVSRDRSKIIPRPSDWPNANYEEFKSDILSLVDSN